MKIIVTLMAALILGACSILGGTSNSPSAPAQKAVIDATIHLAVVDIIRQAKDPAKTAATAQDVVDTIDGLLKANSAVITLNELNDQVQKIMDKKIADPNARLIADTIRISVYGYLQSRLDKMGMKADAILTAEGVGAARAFLQDVRDGIKLAGY